jgi:membrane fusion protein (multidrug efflux system)
MGRRFAMVALLAIVVAAGALADVAAAAGPVVASGVVRSDEKVEVKSKQAVPIARIAVTEGAFVKKGEILVEMSNSLQRAQVEAAKADVARAEAALAEAELAVKTTTREFERNRSVADLITEKELTVSRDAMEKATAARETKRHDLLHARAELGVMQANLDDTVIRAPFDGVVSRIHLRVGATPKGPEQSVLDFQSLEHLYVEVAVPLPYLRSMEQGTPIAVVIEDEHTSIKTNVSGTVRYVYPEIDTALRMFRMKIAVPARELRVLPGMLAKVTIPPAARSR